MLCRKGTKQIPQAIINEIIRDLHDNFIVAYDMGTIHDNALVYRTIKKAKREVDDRLILHSDQVL